ncbi:MAG: hypothetical protein HC831_20820 [Chloroflexia bacterium]|nr:hypothetical protein [Chloroflexia bacterium]
MNKKVNLFIILVLISISQLFAQPNKSLQEFYTDFYMEKIKTNPLSSTYEDATGSPYLEKEFIEGTILMKNQKKYIIPLRFNIYSDNFEFKINNEAIAIENPNSILNIDLDNCTYIYYNLNKRNSFVELIVSGKNNLICKKEVILKKAEPAGAYKEPKPASFIRKT